MGTCIGSSTRYRVPGRGGAVRGKPGNRSGPVPFSFVARCDPGCRMRCRRSCSLTPAPADSTLPNSRGHHLVIR